MSDLIQRLKDASEGSRELDADIHMAYGFRQELPVQPARYPDVPRWIDPDGESCGWLVTDTINYPPRYSTSIDAALQLKPPASAAAVGTMFDDGYRKPWACIWTPEGEPKFNAEAGTPALALCIAALEARNHP
jgi:hypothetical protein